MADKKNQHYVPRCALRPFSFETAGRAINLYNLERKRAIQGAPLKNQCSRDYFYGKDLRAENVLAELEGRYSQIVEALIAGQEISGGDVEWLLLFVAIQTRRTERAIAHVANFFTGFADAVYSRAPEQRPPDPTHDQLVKMSMTAGTKSHDYFRDLKFVVLRNRTNIEFITSDDPAIMTNRLAFEQWEEKSFGVMNSGLILVLPLSPTLVAMFFDIGVYTVPIPRGTRFVDMRRAADVEALNHLQHLNARKNLYFASWGERERIAKEADLVIKQRAASKHSFTQLVRDDTAERPRFRKGDEQETAAAKELVVKGSFEPPISTRWPSFIKYRPKPVTFQNGTAIGHVRKEGWLYNGAANPPPRNIVVPIKSPTRSR